MTQSAMKSNVGIPMRVDTSPGNQYYLDRSVIEFSPFLLRL